jgi:SAM-dependent methyltransferase
VRHHAGMDVTGFRLLLAPGGQRLLSTAMRWYGDEDALRLNQRLRALDGGYPGDTVAAALTQVSLRRAASAKFGADAERMYFTPAGLQQATHPLVASYRAARAGSGPGKAVVDLGCGIGSDLAAFARAGGRVSGVERDLVTVAVATANLDALGLSGSVTHARAEDVDLRPYDIVFADPARRKGTTRLFDPRAFSPNFSFVLSLLSEGDHGAGRPRQVVVKLAPGLDHALVPGHVEAEWVSLDGELKELALWSPSPEPIARGRRATVLSSHAEPATCSELEAGVEPPEVADPGQFLYEPDPAVIRAHLVSCVSSAVHGWLLDPHIAYVCSDHQVRTPLARAFRVVERLPYKEKVLRGALRSRDIGTLTIKKRGIAVTPEDLRRRLGLRGSTPATLVLTRTPRSAAALLVEPLD